jgi:hypothetical protein
MIEGKQTRHIVLRSAPCSAGFDFQTLDLQQLYKQQKKLKFTLSSSQN